jgi:CTP synthase (UTP-ammonia lyase)
MIIINRKTASPIASSRRTKLSETKAKETVAANVHIRTLKTCLDNGRRGRFCGKQVSPHVVDDLIDLIITNRRADFQSVQPF